MFGRDQIPSRHHGEPILLQLQEPGNVAGASYGSDASQASGVAVGSAFMTESPLRQRTGDGSSSSDFVNLQASVAPAAAENLRSH